MKLKTATIISGSNSNAMEIRLGDVLFINSDVGTYDALAARCIASMVVSITKNPKTPVDKNIHLFSIGVDRGKYSIERFYEDGVVVLGRSGKSTFLNMNDITHALLARELPMKINGILIYSTSTETRESLLAKSNVIKTSVRLPDASEWNIKAISLWARKHLGLSIVEFTNITNESTDGGEDRCDRQSIVNQSVIINIVRELQRSKQKTPIYYTLQFDDNYVRAHVTSILSELKQNQRRKWYALNTRFINVYDNEIRNGSIIFGADVRLTYVSYYSVLVVHGDAAYIIVPEDSGDIIRNVPIRFENPDLNIRRNLLRFSIENFRISLEEMERTTNAGKTLDILNDPAELLETQHQNMESEPNPNPNVFLGYTAGVGVNQYAAGVDVNHLQCYSVNDGTTIHDTNIYGTEEQIEEISIEDREEQYT
jgi:hypothetical protein